MFGARPLKDQVVIERDEPIEKSPGGILIPDAARDRQMARGTIRAAGPESKEKLKEGDRVLFSKYAGVEVSIRGITYLIIREENILAVVED